MVKRVGSGWTSAEDARLRVLAADGATASEAAGILAGEGFPARTRNAVLGRACRLKITLGGHRVRLEANATAHAARPAGEKRPRRAPRPKAAGSAPAPSGPALRTVPSAEAPTGAVTMRDLRDWHCHWPLWAHRSRPSYGTSLYCGAIAQADSVYCPDHHFRAHSTAALEEAA